MELETGDTATPRCTDDAPYTRVWHFGVVSKRQVPRRRSRSTGFDSALDVRVTRNLSIKNCARKVANDLFPESNGRPGGRFPERSVGH